MSGFKITSWNINSVRLRLPLVQKLVQSIQPDVLCLQETKCVDDVFPAKALAALGYVHQHVHGMKSYNGVAILSRTPLAECAAVHHVGREDRRHISARLANGLELHNVYIPAGGDVPDVKLNDKYDHKLKFVDELTAWSAGLGRNTGRVVLGDFNIAPLEHDVWSHKQLLDVVSHTEPEVRRLKDFLTAGNWVDCGRHFVPADEKLYSWWSYRNNDWQKSNRGRRLDHIWCSADLQSTLKNMSHDSAPRNWQENGVLPSDHIPITLELVV